MLILNKLYRFKRSNRKDQIGIISFQFLSSFYIIQQIAHIFQIYEWTKHFITTSIFFLSFLLIFGLMNSSSFDMLRLKSPCSLFTFAYFSKSNAKMYASFFVFARLNGVFSE